MIYPTTFSIVAFDPDERAWGVAVASKFPAAGNVVPWARAGAGAVATQSHANTSYGPKGLDLMQNSLSAQDTLDKLLAGDPDRELRQVGLVDQEGKAATFTGKSCHEWAGGITGKHYAIQGNILVGNQVISAMEEAFISTRGAFMWRLQKSLLAGDRAGGDRRGRQSAAIYIVKANAGYGGYNDRWVDYRVDDHPDPVFRLGELLELQDLYFGKSPEDEHVQLSGDTLKALQLLMVQLGYYQGEVSGIYDPATRAALEAFIGNENFEERTYIQAGKIDAPVLDYLLRRYKA